MHTYLNTSLNDYPGLKIIRMIFTPIAIGTTGLIYLTCRYFQNNNENFNETDSLTPSDELMNRSRSSMPPSSSTNCCCFWCPRLLEDQIPEEELLIPSRSNYRPSYSSITTFRDSVERTEERKEDGNENLTLNSFSELEFNIPKELKMERENFNFDNSGDSLESKTYSTDSPVNISSVNILDSFHPLKLNSKDSNNPTIRKSNYPDIFGLIGETPVNIYSQHVITEFKWRHGPSIKIEDSDKEKEKEKESSSKKKVSFNGKMTIRTFTDK